jgi:hypothetical protein
MKITVRVPDPLIKQVRVKCAQEGLRLQDAFGRALFAWLHPKSPPRAATVDENQSDHEELM